MKGLLRSKLALSLAALIMIAAAVFVPLSGTITRSHAAPASSSASAGALWVTGHDVDYHCSNSNPTTGAGCHYLQVAVNFVRNGSRLPILALDHGSEVAAAISDAFGSSAPLVTTVDPRTGFASLPLVSLNGTPLYSAIIVASDITCIGCDNNDAAGVTPDSDSINARATAIKAFFNAGGGILALAGADNMSVFYNFLPITVTAIPVSPAGGSPGGFTLTALGQSLGLTDSDINCCITHNSFQLPASGSPLRVAENDSAGNAETLIAGTLWGVDSSQPITQSFYNSVTATFGAPAFWGRYIGQGRSKDIALTEASFAHTRGFAILPIYFNYSSSAVDGYATGQNYATLAIEDAQQRLGISQGVAIFVDIEQASKPDAPFIQGWYDTFNMTFSYVYNGVVRHYYAGTYKAGYYANTLTSSHFDVPFCTALSKESALGTNSFIWTPQPEPQGKVSANTKKATAPSYKPSGVSCPPHQIPIPAAWQYSIQPKPVFPPNVDLDEALPSLPLWHPVV